MIVFFAAVRALHFASLMAIFGAGSYLALLKSRLQLELPAAAVWPLFTGAAALAFVTAIVWFAFVAGQMSGDWHEALDPAALQTVAIHTRFGTIFLLRICGLVPLLMLCVLRKSSQNLIRVLIAALLLAALAVTSHAAASGAKFPLLRAANDCIHLLAGGFWIGGLLVLITLMRRERHQPRALLAPLRLFSVWGTYAVAALVVSGVINAVMIVPAAAIAAASPYVSVLTAKILVASVMIALAIVNRWTLAPALRVDPLPTNRALSRSVSAEIGLGAIVITIVGFLGLMPPH